jgi:hypothetical protein
MHVLVLVPQIQPDQIDQLFFGGLVGWISDLYPLPGINCFHYATFQMEASRHQIAEIS